MSLLTGGHAAAHAELSWSSPSADSVLPESPSQIVLTFGEPVNTVRDSIRLVAADGSEVDLGRAGQAGGSDTISVDVPELADGSYVVAWRAVSADSHPVSGAFVFAVGSSTATRPGLVDDLLSESAPPASGEAWLGIGRGFSFAGVALLVGGLACTVRCAPSRLTSRSTGVLLWAGVAAGIAGTATMIAAQGSITVGDWLAWDDVGSTTAGRWRIVRLAMFVAAAPLITLRRADRWGGWWLNVSLLGSGALLAVVAAGGHGASGRWVPLGYTLTVVHLAAMSVWAGGLVVVALSVRDDVWAVSSRFSPMASSAVGALAATGVVNAWRQSDSLDGLRDSTYGRWLVVKLAVVIVVLGVAAWNRRRLAATVAPRAPAAARTLRRLVVAEVAGVSLVFVATAGLVNSPPPRAEAAPSLGSVSVVEDGRVAQLTLDPAVTGGTVMHLYVTSTTGSLDQPTDITVSASLPSQSLGPLELPVVAAGPGHVQSSDADLPLAGRWTFTVTARFGEFDATVFELQLNVST
ncbi:MAG: copper resistance protein CopC/CopD [Actinobacteria bacterium]|nr:copper resistance protein CopC/CopD [Actinomycetota bacterium]